VWDDLDGVLRRAELLTDTDRHLEALQLVTPTLAAHPDDPRPHLAASLAQLGIDGGGAEALRHAQEAARLQPHSEHAYRLQALAYLKLDRQREASHVARRAVELEPDVWQTHYIHARTLLNDPFTQDQAGRAAAEAMRLAPHEPAVHLLAAWTHLDGGARVTKEDRRVAEGHIREALRLDPQSSAAAHELARVQLHARSSSQAMSGFADALRMDPQQSVSVAGMSAAFAQWVWRAHLVLWAAGFLVVRRVASTDDSASRRVGLLVALVAAATCVWMVRRISTSVGGRLDTVARAVWRTDKLGAVWAGLLVPVGLGYVLAMLLPSQTAVVVVSWALWSLLAGVVLSWLRMWGPR
jgi:Flp pilus assembly protein TadD